MVRVYDLNPLGFTGTHFMGQGMIYLGKWPLCAGQTLFSFVVEWSILYVSIRSSELMVFLSLLIPAAFLPIFLSTIKWD